MPKFLKKPVTVEAITFDALVAHGLKVGANVVNGMPWSFDYKGHAITHETDNLYVIEGMILFSRGDMLITDENGDDLSVCKGDVFAATYTRVPCKCLAGDCGGTCDSCR